MTNLWMEIEALVLDGVPMDAAQGRRLKHLTEIALTQLLEQRGVAAALHEDRVVEATGDAGRLLRLPAGAKELRWAKEIALAVYRTMEKTI
jgi:hypothetical protein